MNYRILRAGTTAVAAALALAACDTDSDAAAAPEQRVWPVKIVTVNGADSPSVRRFAGRVRSVKTVDLSFQVGGRLERLPVVEGEVLDQGALVAALERQDFERRVREARVNRRLLERTVERQRELADRKSLSAQQLDETESNLELAQVALENAEQDLAYTRLEAPFDALVARRLVENHSNVQPGQGVVRLQDVSELRIEVSVPERLLATISADQIRALYAEFEFLPERRFPLEYREHEAEANSVTQTYSVELGMPRPERVQILPGMTASVTLERARSPGGHLVPLSAVQSSPDGEPFVWRVADGPAVAAQPVELGPTRGEYVAVTGGLESGARIVAAGGERLHDGARIRDYRRQ